MYIIRELCLTPDMLFRLLFRLTLYLAFYIRRRNNYVATPIVHWLWRINARIGVFRTRYRIHIYALFKYRI